MNVSGASPGRVGARLFTMAEPFIKVENLFYSYEVPKHMGPIPALADISLRITFYEFLAIVGHNGSGKSTLAKCISGLLTPTQGQVSVLGLNTRQPANQRQIRAAIGLVLQNPITSSWLRLWRRKLPLEPKIWGYLKTHCVGVWIRPCWIPVCSKSVITRTIYPPGSNRVWQ